MWKTLSTLGRPRTVRVEVLDLRARVDGQAHGDHRLQRAAERGQVDLGVEALEHARLAQRADAGQARARRDPDPRGELVVGAPRVLAQMFEDRPVDGVERQKVRHQR